MGRRQVPGVLAVTYNEGKLPPVDLQALLADEGVRAVITHRAGLVVASWVWPTTAWKPIRPCCFREPTGAIPAP